MRAQAIRLLALGIAVVASVLATVWVLRDQPATPVEPVKRLTLALPDVPHSALSHIAAANGYFRDEGLDVEIVSATHGQAALKILVDGKADLATAAETPFVLGVMGGQPLSVLATVMQSSEESAIVARRDRGIATPRDLAGKRIGVTFGTSGEYFTWAFLINRKVPPESVTMVSFPPNSLPEELAKGTIDAVGTWHPITTRAAATLGENAMTFTETHAYTATHVVIGRTAFVKEHRGTMVKFIRALLKAERFTKASPEAALQLVAGRLKQDVETLRATWRLFEFRVAMPQSLLITLEDEARWAIARRYAEPDSLPNFLPHLNLDPLLAANADRVTMIH